MQIGSLKALRVCCTEPAAAALAWLRRDYAVLPSFGSFTGGADIAAAKGDRLYAFAAERVWAINTGLRSRNP